ncbi:LysR family transcriptional regulator [Streptomyces liangshanensis]|uniref:LysR family transcriptional regulator n=1 Tax=Streptomyces liangshanensis TaxID=2717324 RepID=A0A6G9GSD7_9ACTN|nr:LysR substrate-binding domain-containing protein [Streptomyces liangshanensis]QIQ01120.1 LysR family transcriptional regulator [Streptomyces liangshanensis]
MDVDLRKLRYFVAVAEELHFGRAAERLHIAQPVLSRQIRALEEELRVQLLTRDRRSTALTPAGTQVHRDAVSLLAAAEGLLRRARRAAGGTDRLTVGFMPGITVTTAVQALTARHPGLTVDVLRTSWEDQTQAVRDGRVDVSFVRMPADRSDLSLRPLFSEPRVAVLPRGHRLAGKQSVDIADLAGERLLQDPDAVPEWRDLPHRVPDEDPRPVPAVRTVEEKLEYVAALQGVVVLPRSTALYYTRPDLCQITVADIEPGQVCLAWSDRHPGALTLEFADLAAGIYADGP